MAQYLNLTQRYALKAYLQFEKTKSEITHLFSVHVRTVNKKVIEMVSCRRI